jgi:D-tyrosyl-tRNA(Tyr) deacylase
LKAVIQRVTRGAVTVDQQTVGAIDHGVVVLLGVARGDSEKEADYLAEKISQLRIFEDDNGKMNRSVLDTGGSMLVVSQFTLLGDCRKGRRPSFAEAAPPEQAEALYTRFVRKVAQMGVPTATGRFRASMQVTLTNDGPVTLILEV